MDVIVAGLGIMGSAAAHALAARGDRVIGFDAHPQGHALGSSHGPTRIIRHAMEESPAYLPIVADAFERWHALEEESGQQLLTLCGCLRFGPPGTPLLELFRASAAAGGLPFEELSAAEVAERFPGFRLPDHYVGLFEGHGGVIHAARALRAFQDRAVAGGAELRFGEPVVEWMASDGGVSVRTPAGQYEADRLIVAAGPWMSGLVPELALPLQVLRVVNVTFQPVQPEWYGAERCPTFIGIDDGSEEGFYGCPAVDGEGVKVGGGSEPTDPDRVRRDVDADDIRPARGFVERFMPGAAGPVASTLTCLYTETPDGQFVVDRHPAHDNVVIASPCSGHGFKHASALGPILADLATTGTTAHDIGFLSMARFAEAGQPAAGASVWRRRRSG